MRITPDGVVLGNDDDAVLDLRGVTFGSTFVPWDAVTEVVVAIAIRRSVAGVRALVVAYFRGHYGALRLRTTTVWVTGPTIDVGSRTFRDRDLPAHSAELEAAVSVLPGRVTIG